VVLGFDSSAAPCKTCHSLCELFTLLGVPNFGAAGTVEIAAFLTKFFKSLGAPSKGPVAGGDANPAAPAADGAPSLVGFSGLMLACLEDAGLAASAAKGQFDIRALLQYSAVCGIGLDTVPIPGDATEAQIAALMKDTGTLGKLLCFSALLSPFSCSLIVHH
jgi:hypothetical protein